MTLTMSPQEYDEFMRRSAPDLAIRSLFQDAVLQLTPPGASILEFGAGTGIDAKAYVEKGRRVHVYDGSSEMRSYLAATFQEDMAAGKVGLVDGDYHRFLAESAMQSRSVNAITSNFAVINLIEDPCALFEAFDHWLCDDGFILMSVLNPYYVRDARGLWWWRRAPALLWSGKYSIRAGEGMSYRFRLRTLNDAARPHFKLCGVRPARTSATFRAARSNPFDRVATAIAMSPSLYTFLLFRRR